MGTRQLLGYGLFLLVLGAGWGFTQPMSKVAVSEGYQPFGLIFWQAAIGAALMGVVCLLWGKRVPLGIAQLRVYLIIALIGTLIPNSATYQAAVHLPSGILSILLSMVPIFAFPIAIMLGNDKFELRRLGGLMLGFIGVSIIVLPSASLPQAASTFWVLIALIGGACYAIEGNYVARWGTAGMDPIQALFGASVVGMILSLPLAVLTGQWINPMPPYGAPDYAHIAGSLIHVFVYTGYVWLVGRTGSVFAVQVSYIVTICGVFWARLILSETYSPQIWLALAIMLGGMYLVQPRRQSASREAVAPLPAMDQSGPN
jgi:drug/metabolite transporter (DMT)-like permease